MWYLIIAVPVALIVLFFLQYLNSQRDIFFRQLASKFNLKFEKFNLPQPMKAGTYIVRKLSGSVGGKSLVIEDYIYSTISSFGMANGLPLPLFGNGGWGRVSTKFFVNGQEQYDVIFKESKIAKPNFVAPKQTIEAFLKKESSI